MNKLGPLGLEAAGGAFPERPLPIAISATNAGLDIVGAFDLFEDVLHHDLAINGAQFDRPVSLAFAKARSINLRGSRFAAGLDARSLRAVGDVDLSESVTEREIRLTDAVIWGDLTLDGLKDLIASRFPNDAGEDGSPTIDAGNLEVKGNLRLSDASLRGPLLLDQARLGRSLFMSGLETVSFVSFYGAKIGGDLSANGAILKGRDVYGDALDVGGATIGGAVLLQDGFTTESGAVSLHGAKIGGKFSADGAILKGRDEIGDALDAEGATIGGA